jgi:biotin carboxylase
MRSVKTVLFLSANRTGSGKTYLSKCAALGYWPLLFLDTSEDATLFSECDVQVKKVSLKDAECIIAALKEFPECEIVGVMSSSEYYQELVADVAQRLGHPANDVSSVRTCRDKSSQRDALERAGVPQPRFRKVLTTEQALAAFEEFQCSVVVKPVDETGSIGVRMARTREEVIEATENVFSRQSNVRGMPARKWALVEEYIDAPEFSAEIFQGKVVGLTKKYLGPIPTFLEIGHVFPAPLEVEAETALRETAESAVAALGLVFGPMHVELKLDSQNRAFIIEVNPRLAGGSIPRLLELTGVDLITESIRASAGVIDQGEREIRGASAIWFIRPAMSGFVRGTEGDEVARSNPGVEEVSLYFPKDHQVTLRGDFRDRVGHVITRVPSAPDALALARSVCESISVSMG